MEIGVFVDTTLLVESLLKTIKRRSSARAKIKSYKKSLLPVYAIKELKNGALRHYIWFHNKLSETGSFTRTIHAVQRNFMRPYLLGTALEAMQTGTELLIGSQFNHAKTRAETDAAMADALRLSIRRRIDRGWKDRRKLTTEITDNLSCFAEAAPIYNEDSRLIEDSRRKCDLSTKCCLAPELRSTPAQLKALIDVLANKTGAEATKRRAALHLLRNTPNREFDDRNCSALGDAYFALRCPSDCHILTTNVKDHELLAAALGKSVEEFRP